MVGVQLANARVAADGLRLWQAARLRARTSLVYLPHLEPQFPERLDNSLEAMRGPAMLYDRLGLLAPPMAREPRLSVFERAAEPLSDDLGMIDRVRTTAPELRVRGLAVLPDGRPADGVLVVHPGEDDGLVVAIGDAKLQPRIPTAIYDHLFDAVDSEGRREAGFWRADVPTTRLPRGRPFVLEAWAVDARRMRAHRLPQRVRAEIDGERWSARIE